MNVGVCACAEDEHSCVHGDSCWHAHIIIFFLKRIAVPDNRSSVINTTKWYHLFSPSTHRTVPPDIPLTGQGQSAAATYENVPYEEIPASREVKGDYSYTQNNAYSTVSGREAPAAGEIIYDNWTITWLKLVDADIRTSSLISPSPSHNVCFNYLKHVRLLARKWCQYHLIKKRMIITEPGRFLSIIIVTV